MRLNITEDFAPEFLEASSENGLQAILKKVSHRLGNPAQFYRAEAGPLKDMGVYQVAALRALFGPVVAVSAMASCAKTERRIMVGPDAGTIFPVGAPTHVNALLRHADGVISTIIVSFDAVSATASSIEIFGQDAGLRIDNPHRPDAAIVLQQGNKRHIIPLDDPLWTTACLAIGPVSAWAAFQANTISDCSARNARDVLSILLAIEQASIQTALEWLPAQLDNRTLVQ
jgi:predicted dehydrogenase